MRRRREFAAQIVIFSRLLIRLSLGLVEIQCELMMPAVSWIIAAKL
jgi:hypothetical protein